MKNSGHKRSVSGYSQPSQSKYSQNSLLNTMIRVNKIGGVASNLDASVLNNGVRPSISPYRNNSKSRETTPKTILRNNLGQTNKKPLSENFSIKKKPNTAVNNSYNLMNSMSKSVNTSKVTFNTNRNSLNNNSRSSSRNELLFSKIDNKKNNNTSQNSFYNKSNVGNFNSNTTNKKKDSLKNKGINSNYLVKSGTKFIINNEISQKKFENNLKDKSNLLNKPYGYGNSPINNVSQEKTNNSFNSVNISKLNKQNVLRSSNNFKSTSSNNDTNTNNNSNNNSNNDVLSSLLNSRNYSKSPRGKDNSISNIKLKEKEYRKSPNNNLNILGSSANLHVVHGKNATLNKYNMGSKKSEFNSLNSVSKEKSSKNTSPINSSFNNLNLLSNIKKPSSKIITKKPSGNMFNNNLNVKKINNQQNKTNTSRVNKKEVMGTLIDISSDEFMNKITGKFGGNQTEYYESNNKIKDLSKDKEKNKSTNNNFINNKEENSNLNNISNNNINNSGINLNFSRDNKFTGIYSNKNSTNFNTIPLKNENKLQNSTNSKDQSFLKQNMNLYKNQNSAKEIIDNLQEKKNKINNFKDSNTSPFLKKSLDKAHTERKIISNNSNTLNNKSSIKAFERSQKNSISIDNFKNQIKSNNKSNDNLITPPPKKLRKKILYMSDITKIGFSGQSNKKVNQDAFFVYKNFANDPNCTYMAVCDGHGVNGHDVSGYLKENLSNNLSKNLIKKGINISNQSAMDPNVQNIIKETFLTTNKFMTTDLRVDLNFSGSTCVSLIHTPNKIITINVGDSRAVLGRFIDGGNLNFYKLEWKSHDLSNDHKPSDPTEAAKIIKCGGRIEAYRDENNQFIGPSRVWLKDEDIPGLAMTRSFGDKIANIVGVNCEPEIFEYELVPEDKFFIIASDGVWEFIESDECVNILKDFYLKSDHKGACEFLLKESSRRWMKEEEVIDDITMNIVFFE